MVSFQVFTIKMPIMTPTDDPEDSIPNMPPITLTTFICGTSPYLAMYIKC